MDFLLFQKINSLAGKSICLDALATFFAEDLGYVLIFILFLFLLKNLRKYWPMAVKGFLSAILARFCIVELIRFFWERPRPFIENNVNLLLSHQLTPSFPSGHAAFYFAFSTLVYFYNKKLGILFLAASCLISISRVFAGIHWPSDIIAGALVGVFSGWLVMLLSRRFFQPKA